MDSDQERRRIGRRWSASSEAAGTPSRVRLPTSLVYGRGHDEQRWIQQRPPETSETLTTHSPRSCSVESATAPLRCNEHPMRRGPLSTSTTASPDKRSRISTSTLPHALQATTGLRQREHSPVERAALAARLRADFAARCANLVADDSRSLLDRRQRRARLARVPSLVCGGIVVCPQRFGVDRRRSMSRIGADERTRTDHLGRP